MPKKPPPDCLSCGLCCVSLHDQEAYCDVTTEDLKRLDPRWVKRNVAFSAPFDRLLSALDGANHPDAAIATKWREVKKGELAGVSVCACVALRGDVGHSVKCSIYEKRPQVCHDAVKPGDRSCLDIRRLVTQAVDQERNQ